MAKTTNVTIYLPDGKQANFHTADAVEWPASSREVDCIGIASDGSPPYVAISHGDGRGETFDGVSYHTVWVRDDD